MFSRHAECISIKLVCSVAEAATGTPVATVPTHTHCMAGKEYGVVHVATFTRTTSYKHQKTRLNTCGLKERQCQTLKTQHLLSVVVNESRVGYRSWHGQHSSPHKHHHLSLCSRRTKTDSLWEHQKPHTVWHARTWHCPFRSLHELHHLILQQKVN